MMHSPATTPDALLAALNWRYATKKFDPAKKIAPALWATLEQSLILSASSYGLQPWRFVVVTNPEVRTKLRAVSWNQPQITDSSHLVVFCRKAQVTTADVDAFIARVAEVRGAPLESLKGYRDMMAGHMSKPETLPGGDMTTYTRSQTYIALGFFLSAAAMLGVDACPMEGFDPKKYDEILDLPAQGYHAAVVGAAGYRAGDDPIAAMKKVRHARETMIKHV
jgi:nitroreductase